MGAGGVRLQMTSNFLTLRDADEIAAFYVETTGMQPDFLQLSAGTVDLNVESCDLAGLSVVWARSSGRTLWRDDQAEGTVQFAFVLESESAPIVRGHDIGAEEAMLWIPGQAMEYLIRGPLRTLEIGIDASLVAELGWRLRGEPLRNTSRHRLDALARICRLAADNVVHDDLGSILYWRDHILELLERALEPWFVDSVSEVEQKSRRYRSFELLNQADEYFARLGFSEPFSADELAESIGMPKRTVFYAYRQLLGIGPRRYFELKRLHLLRQVLKRADANEETVTACATGLGFSDLGRMAARYREHFGEYPRDTLARRSVNN